VQYDCVRNLTDRNLGQYICETGCALSLANRDYDVNIRKSLSKFHPMSTQGSSKRRAQAVDSPVKRKRVSRACDQCRTAREKCDGAQPTCSTCSTSRRSCTYTANVKKRGIQPGYIRALELALAYLFQHDPGNEALVNEKLAQGGTSSLLLSRDSKESNKLHKRWRKARFYADVDKLLSGGEPSRQDPSEQLSQDSDEEPSDVEEPSSTATFNPPTSGKIEEQPIFTPLPDDWISRPLNASGTLSTLIPMPPDSWSLLEAYFTYSQSWLPICSKEAILRLSYSYPTEGLALSPELADSGSHAELWSVLAVASLHKTNVSSLQQFQSSATTEQLYTTARSLIPKETGCFDLSHVKAMLNLAIINVGRSSAEAAWLLVGFAFRTLEIMDPSLLAADSRYKHVLHGCFVLDSMLAMQLGRHPYLRAHEARQSGRIDEEGLEEWQPWNGGSEHSLCQQLRTPTLALSSFNALSDLVSLVSRDWKSEDKFQHLEAWKRTLPSKLASVCATTSLKSLTPPAVLLQSTYYCVAFALTSSESWLLQLMSLLERSQDQLGWGKLPPVLRCLVEFLFKRIDGISLSRGVQNRLLRLRAATSAAWPRFGNMHTSMSRPTPTTVAAATPMLEGNLYPPAFDINTRIAPSLLEPSMAEPLSEAAPIRQTNSDLNVAIPTKAEDQFPVIPSDLEAFFDELASLDTTQNPGSQPQFMQNLGFAPDASMADLFSEYIPMSTAFMSQDSEETVNLDQYGFFDGSRVV
jgi:hypothetical protein